MRARSNGRDSVPHTPRILAVALVVLAGSLRLRRTRIREQAIDVGDERLRGERRKIHEASPAAPESGGHGVGVQERHPVLYLVVGAHAVIELAVSSKAPHV